MLRMRTISSSCLDRLAVREMSVSSSSSSSDGFIGRERRSKINTHLSIGEDGFQREEELMRATERALIYTNGSEFRQFAFDLVESRWFNVAILIVIFINTIVIGIQTSTYVMAKAEWYLTLLDQLFLSIYFLELVLKMVAWRLKFFKSAWNIFDFTIVLASVVDFMIPLIVQNIGVFDTRVFRVLSLFRAIRALRALRVIRTIRFLKNLQIIVTTVLQSIPAMGNILILISLVLYIFAIIGRGLYGTVDPGRFGNLAKACFTLFQLITLDDWFFMYSDVRDSYPEHQHILVYLLLFIVLETFIFINLFVAVIVDNLARTQAAANASKPKPKAVKARAVVENDSEGEIAGGSHKRGRRVTFAQDHFYPSVNDYYNTGKLTEREVELVGDYLKLVASLDHHLYAASKHQRTLDDLVDLVDFSKS